MVGFERSLQVTDRGNVPSKNVFVVFERVVEINSRHCQLRALPWVIQVWGSTSGEASGAGDKSAVAEKASNGRMNHN